MYTKEVLSHLPTSLSILCTPCKKPMEQVEQAHQGHCIVVHNHWGECGFAQALLSQWHKQGEGGKEVFLYALLEPRRTQPRGPCMPWAPNSTRREGTITASQTAAGSLFLGKQSSSAQP